MTLALLITAATGAWAQDTYTVTIDGDFLGLNGTFDNVTLPYTVDVNPSDYDSPYEQFISANVNGGDGKVSVTGNENMKTITVNGTFEGTATISLGVLFYYEDDGTVIDATGTMTITCVKNGAAGSNIEVTTNAAEGETTFTEATFTMPAFDATADYELVRDMAVQMTTKVSEEGEDGFRIRIKKDNQTGKFVPAEMTLQEMMALFNVHDGIENQDLVFYGDGKVCDISIFAVDDQDQPTGDAIAFQSLVPGRYVAIATAADGSAYDGETGPSNIFELYQGYEVEIPAGEMITYYKDEAIYVEDEDVQLFSITAVGENTATATQYDVIPANKAMLVKNNSAEPKTVLLIPTETDPLSFTWYDGFVGTLEATTILASDATTDRYAFNGKQFVRVKNDLAVGANKAWLEIPAANNARIINISFEETTGIHGTNWANEANGTWYDLNGRKLDAVPTKKGVYILNGKKVVVK